MQPPPLPTIQTDRQTTISTTLATIAAVCAIIAVPFALIPFVGLAASMLVLGFIIAISIWSRRKRAFIGAGIALLAVLISMVSAFLTFGAMASSRDAANARLAQVQSELQTLRVQAANSSDKNVLGDIIKMMDTNNELTKEQANSWGKVAELAIKAFGPEDKPAADRQKK